LADLALLQERLGVKFKDLSLLEQSVVHSSYVNEYPGLVKGHNERLEFLGDAGLGLVVAEKLYQDYPDFTEGQMSKMRSSVVCRVGLNGVAKAIDLGSFLYMGKGEEASMGREKAANLAGAMEAVIGAVFLDSSMECIRRIILELFAGELREAVAQKKNEDYKSQLQELLQSKKQKAPVYRVVEMSGPDHDRIFVVEVLDGNAAIGEGMGKSKKSAENEAAKMALRKLENTFTG